MTYRDPRYTLHNVSVAPLIPTVANPRKRLSHAIKYVSPSTIRGPIRHGKRYGRLK